MKSDSRRLTLSIILASSLHAAVATSLLVVELPEREPFPEGEYIELGAIEVPLGEQVVQTEVIKTAPKKVEAKAEAVDTESIVQQKLPEKAEELQEQDLQSDEATTEPVVADSDFQDSAAPTIEELPLDENSEALAQEMLDEERAVIAAEKARLAQAKPKKPKIDPVVERRRLLQQKRQKELMQQQQLRAQRWKNRHKQVAKAQPTSTPYGLPNGSRDARTLSQLPGNPKPVYPAPARRKGWQGNVVLAYYVTDSGTVNRLKVLKTSGHQILDLEAVRSISRYRYKPGQAGWTYHPVLFKLSGQAKVEFSGLRTE